jgi:hypothetical protein
MMRIKHFSLDHLSLDRLKHRPWDVQTIRLLHFKEQMNGGRLPMVRPSKLSVPAIKLSRRKL